jgi:hypothetical protein
MNLTIAKGESDGEKKESDEEAVREEVSKEESDQDMGWSKEELQEA